MLKDDFGVLHYWATAYARYDTHFLFPVFVVRKPVPLIAPLNGSWMSQTMQLSGIRPSAGVDDRVSIMN